MEKKLSEARNSDPSHVRRSRGTQSEDDPAVPPTIAQEHREYVVFLARLLLEPKYRRQLDPSDVAHDALLRAQKAIHQYRGTSEPELRCWLREILVNTLKDHSRTLNGPTRDVDRERSFEQALDQSSARLDEWLCNSSLGPEARVQSEESLDQVARAINDLPEDQRTAVELFYVHGYPTREIGQQMGRSQNAVGALIKRGIDAIRNRLTESS